MSPFASSIAPVTVPAWSHFPWLVHGFSTRAGGLSEVYRPGDLNLGFTQADDPAVVAANRERFLTALTGSVWPMATLRQVHSAVTHRVGREDAGQPADRPKLEGDGLITDATGVMLGILTADCVPVLVVDPRLRVVAAFHAGWRGTVEGIVERGVARMHTEFGSDRGDLLAAIGPAIGSCCYSVGGELRDLFSERFPYADKLFQADSSRLRLNLVEANRRQLVSSGIVAEAVTVVGGCTSCDTGRFFSHRAEAGATGRLLAVVGIRSV